MGVVSHPYEFKLIKAKEITVDRLYQRKIQKSMVKEIVNNFDYHKVNCVKVVYREGQYFAFDGQQTTTALRSKFGDNYMIPCLVYYDVPTWVDEAILFEGTNDKKERKAVGIRDMWNSRLNRGDESATTIRRIVERNKMQLSIGHNAGTGVIRALEAIDKAYADLGEVKFEEMIDILYRAWAGTPESLTSPMIRGLAMFVKTYYGEYNKDKLVEKLSKPTALGAIVSGGGSGNRRGPVKYAEEIVGVYNNSLGKDSPKRLDIKKL